MQRFAFRSLATNRDGAARRAARLTLVVAGIATAMCFAPTHADAQLMGRLKKKAEEAAKRKVEDRTEKKAGDATDAALDKAECAIPGTKCDASDKKASNANGSEANAAAAKTASLKPGEGSWKNYDFVPGDRVIFAEDFNSDAVGDFPKRLNFKSGNIEIVEWGGSRYLSTNTFMAEFSIPLPETLPERFTLEFDYSASGGNGATIAFADRSKGQPVAYVDMGTWTGGIRGPDGLDALGKPANEYGYQNAVFPVRIMADGKHVKVYMGETRVSNVPNANLGRSKAIYFKLPGRQERAAMVGNIRVAAGGRPLYDALATKGRVATNGILFATGSDRVSPESTPTLKEIGTMLKEHPELRLTIEGHTDDVGEKAANQTLSEKRAAAVKALLVSQYGIEASRLESQGFGASKPAASNATTEGRQQNRRVELVKR